ncbi:hypothetical protein NDS46_30510 (plasmid) [Paenibacillus thiaminolyticus]|uniref:hypothetical protein n=1 Tax=Paenibacillus thiaminolyticus TaxID=49283 RepID=UPI00232E8159|nr:hypothetical protein [Paenibacillus thiaminolyticus]WCF11682.1 hypothetical protein NDS46_30510 [Paenibacillus thiaminolyticus]
MSKYNYLQVNCGCNDLYSCTAYADPNEYEGLCEGGCGQIPTIKTYDQADDPEYYINVAEGELEMYNHHSRINEPRREYERRIADVEDPSIKLRIAKEICEAYVEG